jgi:prevent-host-death family protein
MQTVSVARAKARLSEILTEVERGGEVVITRRGRPVARVSPLRGPRKPIDFDLMDALRARQPMAKESSVKLLRKMRDERY